MLTLIVINVYLYCAKIRFYNYWEQKTSDEDKNTVLKYSYLLHSLIRSSAEHVLNLITDNDIIIIKVILSSVVPILF